MPKVSIGIPVCNGERYLALALRSILTQTLGDIEVIVSDNASTDSTAEISRAFAACDSRVRYFRNERNIGAAGNFNRTFQLARGEYFHWHGHDDLMAPTYLEKCVTMLDEDTTIVLVQSATRYIDLDGRDLIFDPERALLADSSGHILIEPPDELYATDLDPVRRYRDASIQARTCIHAMGLLRSEVVRRTGLFGRYFGYDRAFLIEMALYGRFAKVAEPLFCKREHPGNSRTLSDAERTRWVGGQELGRRFAKWQEYRQIVSAIFRSPLSSCQKLTCLLMGMHDAVERRMREGVRYDVGGRTIEGGERA